MSWIAVAGPFASGGADAAGRAANLRRMNDAAVRLFDLCRTLVMGVEMALPMVEAAGDERYGDSPKPLSNALVARCDALLRTGGASVGADEQAALMAAAGKPVYRRLEDVPAHS